MCAHWGQAWRTEWKETELKEPPVSKNVLAQQPCSWYTCRDRNKRTRTKWNPIGNWTSTKKKNLDWSVLFFFTCLIDVTLIFKLSRRDFMVSHLGGKLLTTKDLNPNESWLKTQSGSPKGQGSLPLPVKFQHLQYSCTSIWIIICSYQCCYWNVTLYGLTQSIFVTGELAAGSMLHLHTQQRQTPMGGNKGCCGGTVSFDLAYSFWPYRAFAIVLLHPLIVQSLLWCKVWKDDKGRGLKGNLLKRIVRIFFLVTPWIEWCVRNVYLHAGSLNFKINTASR